VAIRKSNYSNWKETTFWLFYIHNPTKTGGEKKAIKRGWKAIGENRERNVAGPHPSENPKK